MLISFSFFLFRTFPPSLSRTRLQASSTLSTRAEPFPAELASSLAEPGTKGELGEFQLDASRTRTNARELILCSVPSPRFIFAQRRLHSQNHHRRSRHPHLVEGTLHRRGRHQPPLLFGCQHRGIRVLDRQSTPSSNPFEVSTDSVSFFVG